MPKPLKGKVGEWILPALKLARFLHPVAEMADEIVGSAAVKAENFEVDSRGSNPVPAGGQFQSLVFLAAQELFDDSSKQCGDFFLKQYIAFLVSTSIREAPVVAATALGMFIYDCGPSDINHLAPTLFALSTIQRKQKDLNNQLQTRFGTLSSRVPSPDERNFIRECLVAFRPWDSKCIDPQPEYKGYPLTDIKGDWQRKHALICPECIGFEKIAAAYARCHGDGRLVDPAAKLRIPVFNGALNANR